ncbi:UDP-glycosyltransferase 87A1 [Forsythia ovata]|uniref:UDP-glycosyltransferase 87A1 n=1 Tax=Forsythia ovata TaxID=205694 RepID=A0ABD1RJS7_9LAMI
MGTVDMEPIASCHVLAMPYPGRGHINPMMNLCKLVAGKSSSILITVVLTEEWLSLIGSEDKPENIRFATVPNVVPSEHGRGADPRGFAMAVWSKMEEPFERLLDELQLSPTLVIADSFIPWVADMACRRNIPFASLWPMSATVFSVFYHFDLLVQHGHYPVNLSVNGDKIVDYIPGLSHIRVLDLPTIVRSQEDSELFVKATSQAFHKAQYLIFTSVYELEAEVIDALKAKASFSIYTIGPATTYFKVKDVYSNMSNNISDFNYLKWLNIQPPNSVLFISLGSFLSVSKAQMDEIVAGLCASGTRFLWVARGERPNLEESCGEKGLVVPWCDQLSVLCHPSVGGFLSHCGWNSTKEATLAGVPMLTFPILMDQVPNAKMIVEDWQIGWRVKREFEEGNLAKRDEIALLVQRFMNLKSPERKQLEEKATKIQQVCEREFADGGSFQDNLDGFTKSILQYHYNSNLATFQW